jgi:O-glycosyl hydrolase
MHAGILLLFALFLARCTSSQQIFDTVSCKWLSDDCFSFRMLLQWTTSEDKSKLLHYHVQEPPLNFTSSAAKATATISIDDTAVQQTIHGFGATLSG